MAGFLAAFSVSILSTHFLFRAVVRILSSGRLPAGLGGGLKDADLLIWELTL